jgi:hypothetical protein
MKFIPPIESFIDQYNYQASLLKHNKKDLINNIQVDCILMEEDIENSYLLGEETFLVTCGLIAAINWLIYIKSFGEKKAICYINDIIKQISNKHKLDLIIEATCKYSPYPDWFVFKKVNALLLCKKYNIAKKISFNKQSKIHFKENNSHGSTRKSK